MTFGAHHLVLVAGALAALAAACDSTQQIGPGGDGERAGLRPVVGATVAVGERGQAIAGVAAGEGGVWIGTAGGCSGSVSRIDPGSNEVVATIPMGIVDDLAVGAGSVWAVGSSCGEPLADDPEVLRSKPRLFRVDPRTNRLVATIPLELRLGGRRADRLVAVAAGSDAVWVSLSFGRGRGEVVRIDPRTNQVAARISARGSPGELDVGAGAVWALSQTSASGASLLRIDPRSNQVVTTLLPGRLPDSAGGLVAPPLIAAGEDTLWLHSRNQQPATASPEGPPRFNDAAVRIDAMSNAVTRSRVSRFFPFAATGDGVWFIGRGARLSRLNPRTLEVEAAVELAATVSDAVSDPTTRSLWIATVVLARGERGSVIRVNLR